MKNRLSFLALGFAGLLVLGPGCGADEGTDGGGDGGAGGGSSCTLDDDCPPNTYCVDRRGNNDDVCDAGEVCVCARIGDGGTGGTGTGGASGASGASGSSTGGTAGAVIGGSSGRGGTGGSTATSALGEPCSADVDCGGNGLICLLPDGLPSGDGPPNG